MRETQLLYPRRLFQLWKKGHVHEVWFWEYPRLFDKHDLALARSQHHVGRGGYHFGEWFTAIHFWKKGYKVLIEKYVFKENSEKFKKASELLDKEGMALLVARRRDVQPPDLLVFDPRHGFFFFVEVKRERDRLGRKQKQFFSEIEKKLHCQVLIVNLRAAK